MERLHPEQKHSSLGISKALKEEIRVLESENSQSGVRGKVLTDSTFKVPSNESNFFTWMRFYISLYYNKLAVNMFGCLNGWKWYNRLDDYVILGALPTPSQIRKLHKQEKVDTVVNLCAEFPGYEKLYTELNITQIRLETPDFTIPSIELIEQGMDQILKAKQEKPKSSIYLHCKAGKGRSAAIAIAYLIQSYQLNLFESQKALSSKRPQVDKDLWESDNLRSFYKTLLIHVESGKYQRIPYNP